MATKSDWRKILANTLDIRYGEETLDQRVRRHHEGPEFPIRSEPCVDCAVVCGMYRMFSDELATCSTDTQVFCSRRWFCHNGDGACRGNANLMNEDARRIMKLS